MQNLSLTSRAFFLLNPLSQIPHTKSLGIWWVILCTSRALLVKNSLKHTSHWCSFFPWRRTWNRSAEADLKHSLQIWHLWSFTCRWTLLVCDIRAAFVLNDHTHSLHFHGRFSLVWSTKITGLEPLGWKKAMLIFSNNSKSYFAQQRKITYVIL